MTSSAPTASSSTAWTPASERERAAVGETGAGPRPGYRVSPVHVFGLLRTGPGSGPVAAPDGQAAPRPPYIPRAVRASRPPAARPRRPSRQERTPFRLHHLQPGKRPCGPRTGRLPSAGGRGHPCRRPQHRAHHPGCARPLRRRAPAAQPSRRAGRAHGPAALASTGCHPAEHGDAADTVPGLNTHDPSTPHLGPAAPRPVRFTPFRLTDGHLLGGVELRACPSAATAGRASVCADLVPDGRTAGRPGDL